MQRWNVPAWRAHSCRMLILLAVWACLIPLALSQPGVDDASKYFSTPGLLREVAYMNQVNIAAGCLSFIGSSLVLLTPALWPSMWRGKVCMQMICMISVCDVMTAASMPFGFPTTNEWCFAQGAIIFFFCRASWMWSVLCLYTLYRIVLFGQVPFSMKHMHLMVWPLNIVLELLPFTTRSWYGTSWYLLGKGLCNMDTTNKYYYIWTGTLFVGPLLMATVFLLFLSAKLWLRIRHMNAGYQKALVRSVVLYPLVTLLACLPLLVVFLMNLNGKHMASPEYDATGAYMFEYDFVGFVFAWNSLQGFLNTLVFFANSGESRERWAWIIRKYWRKLRMHCVSQAERERMKQELEARNTLLNIKDFLDDGEMEQTIQDQINDFKAAQSSRESTFSDVSAASSNRSSFSGVGGGMHGGRMAGDGGPSIGGRHSLDPLDLPAPANDLNVMPRQSSFDDI